jgi:hypothetical protein
MMKPRLVAQIFNLLYRRVSTGAAHPSSNVPRPFARPADSKSAIRQTTSLRYTILAALCLLTSAFCPLALAQFAIDWYTTEGGTDTSTGGGFAVSRTIVPPDQPLAITPPLTGGGFSLVGGFSQPAALLWTNLAGGDWNVASNWSPNFVPTKNDNAVINVAVTVTVSSPAECFGLTLGGFATAPTLAGSGTLALYGPSTWVNGTMSGSGRTVVESGGSFALANPSTVFLNARTLENGGTVLWTGTGTISMNNGVITNRGGALFHAQNAATLVANGGSPRFDNTGTFRKSVNTGTLTVQNGVTFTNSGMVEIQTGTLRLGGGGSATGTFDAAVTTLVEWTSGGFTLNAGAQLNGAGLYKISGATVTDNTTLTVGNLDLITGTLDGTGTITISNAMNWTGGNMSGSGRTIIPPGVTLNLSNASGVLLITRTLENGGSVLRTGAGSIELDSGAVITNRSGALFEVQSAASFVSVFAPNRIDNAGTFRKSVNTGTTTIPGNVTFNNSGTVEIQTGTLSLGGALGGGGTHSGSFAVPAGATLNLAGGTHTAGPSSSITGAGHLTVSGGTASLAGLVNVSGSNTFSGGFANLTGNTICTNNTLTISGGTANFSGTGTVSPAVVLFSSGTLDGSNVVTVGSLMNWTAGTMNGSGRTIIQPGATLNLAVPNAVGLTSRTLENGGTVLWTGTGLFQMSTAVITNRAGALFHAQNSALFQSLGVNRFDNAGTFRKSATTGTTTVSSGMSFNNYGTVDIRSGILVASGSGSYVSSSNALLNCALGGTTPGTGHGQLQVAGTVTLNGALSVDLTNGFSPALNDSFTVLTAGTRNGTFANFSYPLNAVTMQLSNTTTSVIVRVTDVFTAIPRPLLLPPELSGSNIKLTWTAISNANYRLEFNPNLNPSNWNALPGDVTGSSNTASKLDALTASNRLYRVRVIP